MEDISLPFSLRAAFCRIMQCVHLDISPQETMSAIKYARLWDTIPKNTVFIDYSPWKRLGLFKFNNHILHEIFIALICT